MFAFCSRVSGFLEPSDPVEPREEDRDREPFLLPAAFALGLGFGWPVCRNLQGFLVHVPSAKNLHGICDVSFRAPAGVLLRLLLRFLPPLFPLPLAPAPGTFPATIAPM